MEIKILGSGCARCKKVEKVIREVLTETGVGATVDKVKDFEEIAVYGLFATPTVVIDGEVKSVGKIPRKENILKWTRRNNQNLIFIRQAWKLCLAGA